MNKCNDIVPTFSIVGDKNIKHQRIKAEDTQIDMIVKLSEGNPGATTVCIYLLNEGDIVDPYAFMGGLSLLLNLDMLSIYGSRIWMLYKDVCKQDIVNTIAVLRSCQLGLLSCDDLNFAIDNYGKGINVSELYKQVKEQLQLFDSKIVKKRDLNV